MKNPIKDYLKDIIPESKLSFVNRSFEIVGDIAITEIPNEIIEFEQEIGNAIIKTNKKVNTVLKKTSIHEGTYRTQQLAVIAGENKKETTYLENGVTLSINPETVYFSPRLSTEREYLMNSLEDEKRVLVLFSGAGPYTFVALKKQPDLLRIDSIEINPEGHKHALKSLNLNKNLLKKSQIFENLLGFLRGNSIKINEKQLIENLTNLKCHFINKDAIKALENNTLDSKKNYSHKIFDSNDLLIQFKPREIVEKLQGKKKITFNLDKLKDPEDIVPFLIYFSHSITFIIIIHNTKYYLDTYLKKGLLLNYLEQECQIPFNSINLYDEVFMPLPKNASDFLDKAFNVADSNCIIHMYDFVHEHEFPHVTEDKVLSAGKYHKREVEIIETRKVSQYSPRKFRVCCDFIIR